MSDEEGIMSSVLEEDSCSGQSTDDEVKVRESERLRTSVMCEECGEHEAKYRCPGCGLRSCGLHCVKAHKERTQCTGKRTRTSFVSIGEYDDNVLISDYNLLEETLRQADSAKRARGPLERSKAMLLPKFKSLQTQAWNRSTTVVFVAQGMSKRIANTSFYEKKTKRLFWRVEWTFEGTEVRLVDPKVDENLSLESVLSKHFTGKGENVATQHLLRTFRWKSVSEMKLLFRKERSPMAEQVFYDLNWSGSLRDQLANKLVIEYPVFHVVLIGDATKFNIISDPTPSEPCGKFTPTPSNPDPEGVPFREEEIDDVETENLVTYPKPGEKPVDKMAAEPINSGLTDDDAKLFRDEEIEEGEIV